MAQGKSYLLFLRKTWLGSQHPNDDSLVSAMLVLRDLMYSPCDLWKPDT